MYSAKCFLEVIDGVGGNNRIRKFVPIAYVLIHLRLYYRDHEIFCKHMLLPLTSDLSYYSSVFSKPTGRTPTRPDTKYSLLNSTRTGAPEKVRNHSCFHFFLQGVVLFLISHRVGRYVLVLYGQ